VRGGIEGGRGGDGGGGWARRKEEEGGYVGGRGEGSVVGRGGRGRV